MSKQPIGFTGLDAAGKAPAVGVWCTALCLALLYFRPLLEYVVSGQVYVPGLLTQALYIATVSFAALVFVLTSSVTRFPRLSYPVLFLLAAIGVTCLSGLVARTPITAIVTSLPTLFGTWLLFVIFELACETQRGAVAITIVLVVCAAINSLVGVWGVVTKQTLFDLGAAVVGTGSFGYDSASGRSGGINGENYVGMYDLPALVAGLALLSTKRWRMAGIALAVLSSAAIVVSLSRTSILSGLVSALLFMTLRMKQKRSTQWVIVMISIAVYFGSDYITEQVDMPASVAGVNSHRFTVEGVTTESRLAIWESYFAEVMAADPVLGMGGGYLSDQLSNTKMVPHNSFLDIFVGYGCVGLCLYVFAFALVIKNCRKKYHNMLPDLLFASFCGMAVSLVTLSNPFARPLWALAGAVVGVRRCGEVRFPSAMVSFKHGRRVAVRYAQGFAVAYGGPGQSKP